jgi:hypothetical protein
MIDSVCIVSIFRFRTLKIVTNSSDPYWDGEAAATWSIIELNLGIVCGCLPVLRPLLVKIMPGFTKAPHTGSSSQTRRRYREGKMAVPDIDTIKLASVLQGGRRRGDQEEEGCGSSVENLWDKGNDESRNVSSIKDLEAAAYH